jgi:glucokinase
VSSPAGGLSLLADVGGTHARFALCGGSAGPQRLRVLPAGEYGDFTSAARAYLEREQLAPGAIGSAAVALAAPVVGDEVALTNVGWRFSIEATRRALGLDRLVVLNDFEALALSLPALVGADLEQLAAGRPGAEGTLALLGPGTGLGVAGLLPLPGGGWRPIAGEGGHRDLAAANERECRVIERLGQRFGHVSAERALSGPGLAAIERALREVDGAPAAEETAEEVSARARAGADPYALEACRLFSAWLGAVAGDLALTLGARGGVYLAGGALAGLGTAFDRPLFLGRFLAKGRLRAYLGEVPVRRIVRPDAALVGLSRALR